MLGSPILYLKAMRIDVQVSGFYFKGTNPERSPLKRRPFRYMGPYRESKQKPKHKHHQRMGVAENGRGGFLWVPLTGY